MGAVGLTAFAAVLMVMAGVMHVIQGIVAIVNDDFFVLGQDYVFEFDLTAWGWAHLIVGIVVFAAGVGLFTGQVWARTAAVVVACLSILASFAWLPYYPLWSMLVIALGVLVIWAVTAHGRDISRV
jgi:hypothetical protein